MGIVTFANSQGTVIPLTNLKSWIIADNAVYDGSNLISSNADASGNSNSLTSVNKPLYVASALNGHAVMRFDGSDDYMTFPTGFMYNWANITFFMVVKHAYANNKAILGGGGTYSNGIIILSASGNGYLNVNGSNLYTNFISNNVFAISDFTRSTTATNAYVNGASLGALVGGSSLSFNGVYTLGRYYAGGYNAAFDIAELIIYDAVLLTAERQQVENYLNAKYTIF